MRLLAEQPRVWLQEAPPLPSDWRALYEAPLLAFDLRHVPLVATLEPKLGVPRGALGQVCSTPSPPSHRLSSPQNLNPPLVPLPPATPCHQAWTQLLDHLNPQPSASTSGRATAFRQNRCPPSLRCRCRRCSPRRFPRRSGSRGRRRWSCSIWTRRWRGRRFVISQRGVLV